MKGVLPRVRRWALREAPARWRWPRRVLWSLALVGSLLSLLGYASGVWWALGLLEHLRFQGLLGLVGVASSLLLFGDRRAMVLVVPILGNLLPLTKYWRADGQPRPDCELRVLHYNLDLTAASHEAAFETIRRASVDLVSLQEVTPALAQRAAQLLSDYQVIYSHPLENSHGSLLLRSRESRLVRRAAGVTHLPSWSGRPLVYADFSLQGVPISFLSLHVTRPRNAETSAFQELELQALAAWSRQRQHMGQQLLIVGDFNATPWSRAFTQLLSHGQLHDSLDVFGWQPSWPSWLPFLARLPIDHALASKGLVFVEREVGPAAGGDHLPLQICVARR